MGQSLSDIFGFWGLVIAVLSLVWTVGYTVWIHRRSANQPRLFLRAEPCVGFAGPDMYFQPQGSKKKIKLKPGHVLNEMVSIFAYNTGAQIITLTSVYAAPKNQLKQQIALKDCWINPTESGTLPHVLQPGDKWEALCDWRWLSEELSQRFGRRSGWSLRFETRDLNGVAYSTDVELAENTFAEIARKRQQEFGEG